MTIRGGEVRMFVKGVQVDMYRGIEFTSQVRRGGYFEASELPTINLPKTITITMKIAGRGIEYFLCPASVTRTRTGAWLVKGRGPSRRYSTQARAVAVARERDRRYAAEHRAPTEPPCAGVV